jgi:hypothetical protein
MSLIKLNADYEVATPSGFQDFYGIRSLDKENHLSIELSNGKFLKCSLTHPFFKNGKEVLANTLKVGSTVDGCDGTLVSIVNIDKNDSSITLYDLIDVSGGNIFNVDGIVSHNCDFTTTGHTVLEVETLKWVKSAGISDPIERRWVDQSLWIWQPPDYSRSYLVCADVARGDGRDKSAFHVLDMASMEQVAEFKGLVDTKGYGNLLVSIATEYNNAILVVENNNVGWATLQQIIDIGYPNTFWSSADLQFVDLERQVSNKLNRTEKNMVPGFTTTTRTRPLIISKLETYFRDKAIKTNSVRLYEELSVFIWNGSKAEAMTGYNDDLVTSLGVGLWVRDTALRLRADAGEYQKALVDGINKTGGGEPVYRRSVDRGREYWVMPSAAGSVFSRSPGSRKTEDLKWLL